MSRVGMLLRTLGSPVTAPFLAAIGLEGADPDLLLETARPFASEVREHQERLERGEEPATSVDAGALFDGYVKVLSARDPEVAARVVRLAGEIPSIEGTDGVRAWLKVLSAVDEPSPEPLPTQIADEVKMSGRRYREELQRWLARLREQDSTHGGVDWQTYMNSEDYLVLGFIQQLLESRVVGRWRRELEATLTEDGWRDFLRWGARVLEDEPRLAEAWRRSSPEAP